MDPGENPPSRIDAASSGGSTVAEVLGELARHPVRILLARWNWKAALFSSLIRASIYYAANFAAGPAEAAAAMRDEFIYRAVTAGIQGAITQQMSRARPAWAAGTVALILLPAAAHGGEIAIHLWRGVPHFGRSLAASVWFTLTATLFNLHVMRRGILLVGGGSQSLGADMRQIPRAAWTFMSAVPMAACRAAGRAWKSRRAGTEHS